MAIEIWLMYGVTVLALMSTPGPSQLLMLSNSSVHGFRNALATAAGDLMANALQMLAAGLGLATLIMASAHALTIIKWLGVAYLTWLGVRMILRAKTHAFTNTATKRLMPLTHLWLQGFMTSAANPKAIVFFAALFPQFIQSEHAFWPQFFLLSATYLVLDGIFLSLYGYGASWIAARLRGSAKTWVDRAGGGLMIAAAVVLGLKSPTVQW